MRRNLSAALLVAALALGQLEHLARADDRKSDEQHQPSPEPYSFSYSAPSAGGQVTHQESGDGSGRITGFYTIQGEDGRERRVDYVADENGYRASVSTNEVGTRSENSADVEWSARLPSAGQLEAAKVSAEEYQYLEQSHATEHERHLSRASQSVETSNRNQPGPVSPMPTAARSSQQERLQPRQQQQSWTSSNLQSQPAEAPASSSSVTTTTNSGDDLYTSDADGGWRARGAKLQAQRAGLQQQRQQQGQDQQASLATSSIAAGPQVALGEPQAEPLSQQQQQPALRRVRDDAQQVQAAAWQMVGRGATPARRPTVLQRQLEQQFMLQAQQLTDQDYPRQAQLQEALRDKRQQVGYDEQAQQPQQQLAVGQPSRTAQTGGQGQADFSQVNQQQSNIIDELDQPVVVDQSEEQGAKTNEDTSGPYATQEPANQQQVEPKQPTSTTTMATASTTTSTSTTTLKTPTGLVAIDLSDQDQEVDQLPEMPNMRVPLPVPQQPQPQPQQMGPGYQQETFVPQQVTKTSKGNEQVVVEPEGPKRRPNSIEQVIQSLKQPEPLRTTPAAIKVPQATTLMPIIVSSTKTTTTQAPVVVETTRLPVYVEQTTTPRYSYAEQQPTTTTTTTTQAPVEVVTMARPASTPLIEKPSFRPSRRPQQQQQKQQVGTKGGSGFRGPTGPRWTDRPTINPQQSVRYVPQATRQPAYPTAATSARPEVKQPVPVVQQPSVDFQRPRQPTYRPQAEAKQPMVVVMTTTPAPARTEYQQPQQWKGAKGGSRSKKQFWQQQQAATTGGRVLTQSVGAGQRAQASGGVDYANPLAGYGSRVIAGR